MAHPERFELPTKWFEATYSIQLSYGREGAGIIAFIPDGLKHCEEPPENTGYHTVPQHQPEFCRFALIKFLLLRKIA